MVALTASRLLRCIRDSVRYDGMPRIPFLRQGVYLVRLRLQALILVRERKTKLEYTPVHLTRREQASIR
jgi:hypothetical protein